METTENKTEIEPTNEGVKVLTQVNNTSGLPTWLKSINSLTLMIIGVVIATGLNLGTIVNKYIDQRVVSQNTEQTTNGELQKNSLAALIDISNGLSKHVVDLTLSVQTLIDENKRLTSNNDELNKTITKLQENISALQLDNERLKQEIAALKTQISELQKSK